MTRRTPATRRGVVAFGAMLLLATVAGAQTPRDETMDHVLSGDVEVADPIASSLTVRDDEDELTTVVIDDATTLLQAAQHIPLAGLAKGDRVVVEWNDRTGRNLATYVEVVDAPASPAPAAPHTRRPAGAPGSS